MDNIDNFSQWFKTCKKEYSVKIFIKNRKRRKIIIPSDNYKLRQTYLNYLFNIKDVFLISDSSHGWIKNKNIVSCAKTVVAPEGHKNYILAIDIKDFFTNITSDHLEGLFAYNEKLPEVLNIINFDINELIDYVTIKEVNKAYLPQGFVTSPLLANAVRYPIDLKIERICRENNYTYANYGDNLYFGSNMPFPISFTDQIKDILNLWNFEAHPNKTRHMPWFTSQIILGLTVNQKISISKDFYKETLDLINNSNEINDVILGKIAHFKLADNPTKYNFLTKLVKNKYG